jgi:hypothetical protein
MNRLKNLDERVRSYLGALGIEPEEHDQGLYPYRHQDTIVFVSIFAEDDEPFVRFVGLVLCDFEPTLEVLHQVLRLNTMVLFGSFLFFESNTLAFSATLLGDHVDADEFEKTLNYVAKISSDFDQALQDLCGGLRGADLLVESSP